MKNSLKNLGGSKIVSQMETTDIQTSIDKGSILKFVDDSLVQNKSIPLKQYPGNTLVPKLNILNEISTHRNTLGLPSENSSISQRTLHKANHSIYRELTNRVINQQYDMDSQLSRQITNSMHSESSQLIGKSKLSKAKFQKLDPKLLKDVKKMTLFNQLIHSKQKIRFFLKRSDQDEAIKEIQTIMTKIIEMDDMKMFVKSIEVQGDLSISSSNFQNAFFCYNKLRQIGEYTGNNELKVNALVQMADVCKLIKKYEQARKLLKKAIQYVWYENNPDEEAQIYDKLGMIYFLEGDIVNAKQFHERSVCFLLEEDNSPAKKHANETVKKYLRVNNYRTSSITTMFLAKLGMIGEKEGDQEVHNTVRFQCNMNIEQQIEALNADSEFQVEISTPGKQCKNKTRNGYIQEEFYGQYDERIVRLHKQQQEKQLIIVRKVGPIKERVQMEPNLLKHSLEKQISERIDQKLDKRSESVEQFKKELIKLPSLHNRQMVVQNQDVLMFNHLTPNRNIIGFNQSQKPCGSKINALFDGVIENLTSIKQDTIIKN